MVVPGLFVAAGLYASIDRPREWMPGAPLLLLLFYSMLVIATGRTRTVIDREGFHIDYGPLPCARRAISRRKHEIRALFPRHLRESPAKGVWVDHYYAAVETNQGDWVNLNGPYTDWAAASEASRKIAILWGLSGVGAGRSGLPKGWRDWSTARVLLLWFLAYACAFAWAIAATMRFGLA